MRKKNLKRRSNNAILRFSFLRKLVFIMVLFLTFISYANAQHCDGCSVNINGPDYVHVGDTVIYTATPQRPDLHPDIYWDFQNMLEGYGEVLDQGTYSSGEEWIRVHFIATGWVWFTFEAQYQPGQDYDEIYIQIVS